MHFYRSLLAAVLINCCRAEILELSNTRDSVTASDDQQLNNNIQTEKYSMAFWFTRPALLDNLHKTLSKLDKILKKTHYRRLVQDVPRKPKLREDAVLITKASLYHGKSTHYGTILEKWPKVITRRKQRWESRHQRYPKGMDKAIDVDDMGTTNWVHLVNKESTKGVKQEAQNKGDKPTTSKSILDPTLSPYSIKAHLQELASNFSNANISLEVIGRTVSYNDIVLLKVTEKKASKIMRFHADEKYLHEEPEKKIIFIVHGLSVMGVHLLPCMLQKEPLKQLMSYYFAHLDKFDILLMPMANPDGLTSGPLLWNKNMSPQTSCPGVYLDRNFDVMWNNNRTTSSCSPQFPGPSPFSEQETRAVRDVIHRYSHKIIAYLHLHSATYTADVFKGDAVLFPKGYADLESDDDKYMDLRGDIDEAMKNASFQVLTVAVDTLYNWYGRVTGSSVDYASTVYGIPYAMELVMQIYMDDPSVDKPDERESAVALREVWQRVIDVIFNNVHKYVQTVGE